MFITQGFIFRRWLYIHLWYGALYIHQYKHSSTYLTAYTDACKRYHTIPLLLYSRLPEGGPSCSKHVEAVKK